MVCLQRAWCVIVCLQRTECVAMCLRSAGCVSFVCWRTRWCVRALGVCFICVLAHCVCSLLCQHAVCLSFVLSAICVTVALAVAPALLLRLDSNLPVQSVLAVPLWFSRGYPGVSRVTSVESHFFRQSPVRW